MSYRYPFSPYPTGWFFVAHSDELASGAVMPLKYFGKDLVLFRTESGTASLLDAHCVHLGAHLGHGGKVEGECIKCPFHAWKYDGTGQCTEIPYAERIPPRAKISRWSVRDLNGVIWAWYDEKGRAPLWELPEIPGYTTERWTKAKRASFKVKMHVQEFRENAVDNAHFVYVHKAYNSDTTGVEIDGPILRGRTRAMFDMASINKPGVTAEMILDFTSHGLGVLVAEEHIGDHTHFIQLAMSTPIDEEYSDLVFSTRVEILSKEKFAYKLLELSCFDSERQLAADIPIWENKIFRDKPALCDGDGPITFFRRWVKQFYPSLEQDGEPRAVADKSKVVHGAPLPAQVKETTA